MQSLTRGPKTRLRNRVHISQEVADHVGEVVELGFEDKGRQLLCEVLIVIDLQREAVLLVLACEPIQSVIEPVNQLIEDVSIGHVRAVIEQILEISQSHSQTTYFLRVVLL